MQSPVADQWIFNGQLLYNYNPATRSAVQYAPAGPKARQLNQIVDLVMNVDSLLKRYQVLQAVQDGSLVQLKPKSRQDIKKVDLHLDLKNDYISWLKLYFRNGNNTTLDFRQPKRGQLPASVFALPQGVQVTKGL